MTRKSPNFVALGFALMYLVCLIFLPVYTVLVVSISGMTMMQFGYALIYLPVVLALAMAVSCMVLDRKVSIAVGAMTAVVNVVFLVAGNGILTSGSSWALLAGNVMTNATGANVMQMIPVAPGVGCILCVVLALGFIVVEVLLGQSASKKKAYQPTGDVFDTEVF